MFLPWSKEAVWEFDLAGTLRWESGICSGKISWEKTPYSMAAFWVLCSPKERNPWVNTETQRKASLGGPDVLRRPSRAGNGEGFEFTLLLSSVTLPGIVALKSASIAGTLEGWGFESRSLAVHLQHWTARCLMEQNTFQTVIRHFVIQDECLSPSCTPYSQQGQRQLFSPCFLGTALNKPPMHLPPPHRTCYMYFNTQCKNSITIFSSAHVMYTLQL